MGSYSSLPNKLVSAANGIDYAYRDTGEGAVPLVLFQHFRGNLDNWYPALIDALASSRRVVTFDNTGVGLSTGTTPHVIEQMAQDAIATPSASIAAGEGGQAIHTRVRGVAERLFLGPGRYSVDRGLDDLRHVFGVGDHRDVVCCDLDGGRAHALGKLSLGIGWNRLVAVGDKEPRR
jgi:pimeloyl-ACP methyl ester carboxylesterase